MNRRWHVERDKLVDKTVCFFTLTHCNQSKTLKLKIHIMRTAFSTIMFLVFACNSFSQVNDTIIFQTKFANNPWQLFAREILTYDDNCNILTERGERWDVASHSWINLYSHTNRYDEAGNLSVTVSKAWDEKKNAFINSTRNLYDFDGSHETSTFQFWSEPDNNWVNDSRYMIDRNKDDLTTFLKVQYYVDNRWEDVARDFFVYGDNNIEVAAKEQAKVNGVWENSIKTVQYLFHHASKGTANTYTWNNVTESWDKVGRELIAYLSGTANITEQISQDYVANRWENSRKMIVIYNKDNLKVFDVIRSWDSKSQSWVNLFRDFQDYYSNGATHHLQMDAWDEASKRWIDSYRMTFTNNGCRIAANLIAGNTNSIQKSGKSNEIVASGIPIGRMANDGHKVIYDLRSIINPANKSVIPLQMTLTTQRPERITGITSENISEKKQQDFLISPNPAGKYFYVGFNTAGKSAILKITDLAGRAMLQAPLKNNNEKVDISNISKGLYIVSVISGREILSKKLVVE